MFAINDDDDVAISGKRINSNNDNNNKFLIYI
jgi:hypothetical protein